MIKLMLVDDQEMIRIGLSAVLGSFDDIDVVGAASDGLEAIEAIGELRPDVVLMDIRMPGIDGVEATARIRERYGDAVRIVMLTTFEQDDLVFEALQRGANGFLGKAASSDQLVAAVREVADGGGTLSAKAAAAVIARVAEAPKQEIDESLARRFALLTAREREITVLAATGASNETIAGRLFLSPYTVKTHANRAMAKLGARDRAQLIAFWHSAGQPT